MLRTLYLDTALWNRLFECGVDPCLLTHALEQNRWELAISPHVMYELAKSFRGKRTESQKKAVPLFSYVKEFLDLRIACVKQVPDLGYRSFTEQYFDSCGIFRDAVIAIIATVAKQERIRISERVKAGLETARAKGKRLGRPRVILDARRIGILRAQGLSWAKIAAQLGVGEGTVYRLAHASAKNPLGVAPVSPCAVAAD